MLEFQYFFIKHSAYRWIATLRKRLSLILRFLTEGKKFPLFFTNKVFFSVLTQLLVYWFLSGFFVLKAPMEAVVTRLGNYERTVGPGIHWHLRFVEKLFRVEINQPKYQTYTLSTFTSDANLVTATLDVEYSITDSRLFLFGICDARQYISETIVASLQKVISCHTLAALFNSKTGFLIQKELKEILREEIDKYPLGIRLLGVSVPTLNPPMELKKDFDEFQKAITKSKEIEFKAKSKAKQLEHEIELKTQSLYAHANIQKHVLINKAIIETNRFLALLPYYEKYPEITLQRLRYEKSEKTLKQANNMIPINLYLDKTLLALKENRNVT